MHVGVFLITLEDVGLGDDSFEQAGDSAVDDGQNRPAIEVRQCFVQRQIGIQEGRAIVGEQLLNGLIDTGGCLHQLGQIGGGQNIPTIAGGADEGDLFLFLLNFGGDDGGGIGADEDLAVKWTQCVLNAQRSLFSGLFHGGQVQTILQREGFKDRNRLQAARDEVSERVGENDGKNDGIIAAELEDHEDAGERDAQEAGE